jgi:hypothetical protein
MNHQSTRVANWNKNNSNLEPRPIIQKIITKIDPTPAKIAALEQFDTNLTTHLETSDNTFSIDNVNTIPQSFSEAINKLNFTANLINEKKDEIIAAGNYSSVLRPTFELKYGLVKPGDDYGIYINTIGLGGPPIDTFCYFAEAYPEFENKYGSEILEPFRTLSADIDKKYFNERMNLINTGSQNIYYMCEFKVWQYGVSLVIDMLVRNILDPSSYMVLGTGVKITLKMSEIDSYLTVPPAFYTYLQQMENAFNTFSKIDYDSTLGTIYQFGDDKNFHILKVVSSPEYPSWDNQFIVNCYIPGSNINMPEQIFQINAELNRNYTGTHVDEIVIVNYVVGSIYYTGVVKMLQIPEYINEYSELCYQIISININEIFQPSIKITGDSEIQGNLQVLKYNGEPVIETDNTRKITTFHDKVGINQQSHEVEGLLDIDNLTHQVILDLFDTFVPYSLNSYDVMQTIIAIDPYADSKIGPLFLSGNSLFDYTNQVDVISVPIKPIILATDIVIMQLHTTDIATLNFESPEFYEQLGQIVKEVNQMAPEILNANDPDFIFSFMILVPDINKRWYILSLRAIIRDNNLIFTITHFDITYLMVDSSYKQMLIHIYDYVSREFRYMNFIALLMKDTLLYTDLRLDSLKFEDSIKNNPFFSNQFNLLPESYVFNVRIVAAAYEYIGANLSWNGQELTNCWDKDLSVNLVVDNINYQTDQLYNNRTNAVFPVNYLWQSNKKLSFVNRIIINDILYLIGSGVNLNTLLSQSLLVRGDNTISGNFYVADSNNNNIFKVDNVEKTITNSYKVGIGMDNPESILHIKDTTVQDVLDELKVATKQHNLLNNLVFALKDATSETEFGGIIESIVGEQTIDQFFLMYKVELNTLRSEEMKVMYHWHFKQWEDQVLKDTVDYDNNHIKQIIIRYYNDLLDDKLIYDTAMFAKSTKYIWGDKRGRGRFLNINGDLYIIGTGTNIQTFGLRINTNNNLTTLMETRTVGDKMLNEMYRRYMYLGSYNVQESLNALNTLMKQNEKIEKKTYIIKIDITQPLATKVSLLNFENLQISETTFLDDMSNNDKTKYISFWTDVVNSNDNISIGFYILSSNEGLYYDYHTACKCVSRVGDIVTLICVEFIIQDCIIPSLNVEGDARVIGDLMITNQTTKTNFVSIDPVEKFVGINTDERYIQYDDTYTTSSNMYSAKHNMYIKNDRFPVLVSERTQEDATDIINLTNVGDTGNNLRYFDSYSSANLKRNSDLYTFKEMRDFALENDTQQRAIDNNTITHTRYGTDLMFEVSDKTGLTQDLGAIKMTIDDRDDDTGRLKGGFGVQVSDDGIIVRDLMYVDNSGTLFINKINLGGKVLEVAANGDLLYNGIKLD